MAGQATTDSSPLTAASIMSESCLEGPEEQGGSQSKNGSVARLLFLSHVLLDEGNHFRAQIGETLQVFLGPGSAHEDRWPAG